MLSNFSKILFILIVLHGANLFAEDDKLVLMQTAIQQSTSQFETYQKQPPDTKLLDALETRLISQKSEVQQCIEATNAQLASTQTSLGSLGDKQDVEESDIKAARRGLEKQIATVNAEQKSCSLLKIKIDLLIESTIQLRSKIKKEQFFSKEFSIVSGVDKLSRLDAELVESEFNTVLPLIQKVYAVLQWKPVIFFFSGLLFGYIILRYERQQTEIKPIGFSVTFRNTKRGLLRTAPLLFAALFLWVYFLLLNDTASLIYDALLYLTLLFFTYGLIRGVLFPRNRQRIEQPNARLLHFVRVLSWLFVIFTLTTFLLNYEETGRYANSVVLYLAWLTSLTIAAFSFILLLWLISRYLISDHKKIHGVYILPVLSLLIAILAGLAGYRNISTLLFFGTVNSLIIIIISLLMLRVANEFFDSMDEGRLRWQGKLRRVMHIEPEKAFPGVLWLRILSFFSVVLIAIMVLMFVWGSSHQHISSLVIGLKDGIKIGNLHLDLLNLAYAFLAFVVILSILPFIKNQLLDSWLKHSNLSSGAKDATKTLVGYAGAAIAVLWALYIAGVNFKSLAIVAGALSVGIGFGLQNIVNNFVSGLIILFERPVRRGDWIMVGATEGIVKDISIRSTTIQTFNKSDVIVPNSELISNQVTNWMLTNNIGRLQASVGVAYGTDVATVIKILESVARSHPEVISGHQDYQIQVLFLEFGESSLNFELRCFVKHVTNRLTVLSNINQEIDRKFRKAGIEIPYPQRDLNIKSSNISSLD
ncbi:MAG: Unknown protein [uncultured Thiotrichaceae bacterium]|uniref:Potassium efflux system KefA protein / Small-conductance mechanosensitive channel n=1 Tax=uncultured Thiotrichaceae bacterium TaxID=298394 RepID=A0A6S6U4C6_9GAMM|nr:MAG: Unknown protein [uncultured Thiotrichaceae bacterium]